MAGRSSAPSPSRSGFPRGRLTVGILLVALVGAGVAWGLSRLRGGPDPGRVVFASEDGVFVRELASGMLQRRAALPGDTLDAWPDPAGRWLAYLRRRGDLWMLDLESGSRWQISDRLSVGIGTGWSPDGRFVAGEVADDRDLVAIDPGDRGTKLLTSGLPVSRIVWIDKDRFVAATERHLVVVRLGGDRPSLDNLLDGAWPLAVSPDGGELLYVGDPEGKGSRVVIGELVADRVGAKRTVFHGIAYRAAVSPQGFVAFSGRERSNAGGTWVLEARSRPPRRVTGAQAESIAFSRDGSSLLYVVNGALYARDLRDERTVRLSRRGTYVKAFAVVP